MHETEADGIAVDGAGNAYVTGSTQVAEDLRGRLHVLGHADQHVRTGGQFAHSRECHDGRRVRLEREQRCSWLTAVPASGVGSGRVTVTVSPNATVNPRTGQVTIAGTAVTVTQPGGGPTNCFNDADCDGVV